MIGFPTMGALLVMMALKAYRVDKMEESAKLWFASIAVVGILALTHTILWWDEAVYVNNAYALNGVSEKWRFVAWERQPGISILESVSIAAFGEFGFQIIALLGAFGLVATAYAFVRKIGGKKNQALVAGLFALFSPAFWAAGYTLASDAWGALISLLSIFFYEKYLKKQKPLTLIISLILAGVSFWFRDFFAITALIIVFWEVAVNKKIGLNLAGGLLAYAIIIGMYLADSATRFGSAFGRVALHFELISKKVGYVFSDPTYRVTSWALLFAAVYGPMAYRISKSCKSKFLCFAAAVNAILLFTLDFQVRYALLPTVLIAILYGVSMEKHDKWSHYALFFSALVAVVFYGYLFFAGPENNSAMTEACNLAKTVNGDLYTVGNAPFLSQCSQRPVYGMEAGCEGGTLLAFREKELFKPYLEKCT